METTNNPSREVRVPWDRLRAWIDTHDAFERENNSPALVSQAQLQAISLLISFGDDEPDLGEKDHVSALMQTIQIRRLLPPTFVDDEPINVPVDGHLKLMWRCVCTVENYGSFPRANHGVEAGKQPPSFQSKKNAKRYAAKHALQFIKHFPQAAYPFGAPPSERNAAMPSPSPARKSPAQRIMREDLPPGPSRSSDSPASDTRSSNGDPDSDELAVVLRQITELTGRLGLDNPSIRIEPDADMPNFFSGWPVFKNGGGLIPQGLGAVSGVLGRRQAKMQVAREVLEWLQGQQKIRDDILFKTFWKQDL